MKKAIVIALVGIAMFVIVSAKRCDDTESSCDYPFEIEFDGVALNDTVGGEADFYWTIDVVNNRGEPQLDEPIVMDSDHEDHPVVVASLFENEETGEAWVNVSPFPGIALLNEEGTQIVGGLFLMVVWPHSYTETGNSFELGDVYSDQPPEAAAFLFYGPTDYNGQIMCLVRLNTGSCSGQVEIRRFANGRLSVTLSGMNYPISESEIRSLTGEGTALCEEG